MLIEIFTLMLTLQIPMLQPPVFHPARREVSNWRNEATGALDLPWASFAGLWLGRDPKGTSRCVRLNNYWCIKRAGWAGEIAADAEGHVAFASAQEGALVAAVLLKRYYVDFKRRSATEIVSRWAPAQCGALVASGRTAPTGLARRGLGNTLRARFLAHRRNGAPLRRSVVADRPVAQVRLSSIAVGVSEVAGAGLPTLGSFSGVSSNFKLPPLSTCSGDGARIENYARRASNGIGTQTSDLKLFGADGLPTENLAKLMLNMSSVEIGPLAPRTALVDAAVAALVIRLQGRAENLEPHF